MAFLRWLRPRPALAPSSARAPRQPAAIVIAPPYPRRAGVAAAHREGRGRVSDLS